MLKKLVSFTKSEKQECCRHRSLKNILIKSSGFASTCLYTGLIFAVSDAEADSVFSSRVLVRESDLSMADASLITGLNFLS